MRDNYIILNEDNTFYTQMFAESSQPENAIKYTYTGNFVKPKFNIELNEPYEGATDEDIEAFEDAKYPNEISRRQLRLQWQLDGRNLAEIEAKINEIKDTIERIVALNAWTESAIFLRDDILIQTLGASLSMSKSDIREFFKRASLL